MTIQSTLIAAAVLSCSMLSSAWADCSTVPFRFMIESNSVLTTNGVTDGAPCSHVFTSKTIRYEKSNIEKQAKNGKVEQEGLTTFSYTPKKGFKGKDTYALKLCGYTATNKPGCVTVNYDIEIK